MFKDFESGLKLFIHPHPHHCFVDSIPKDFNS